MKLKTTKKSKKQRGNTTQGHGARKKWKKSGHKGGYGNAGTGKRGDQKKSLILKKYGNKYFGKQGITSKSTKKRINKVINLEKIQKDYNTLSKKHLKGDILDFSDYKLLAKGEITNPLKIKVKQASQSAIEKIKKAGGEIDIIENPPKEE